MSIRKSPGRIITFYSYKGGTGRSMALANVAWILASQGKRVLMVDWDLEAPGLHLYVHPFLSDKSLCASEGVIDLVSKFEAAAIVPKPAANDPEAGTNPAGADDRAWYLPFAEISKYCIPLAWSFPQGGTLDLLPAGKQDQIYAARVNSFNWTSFYDRLGGGVFLEAVKKNMREHYDYIFIDSRTGVSDTAGVCTVQMPDTVVVCFTFNNQSIQGAAAVASSIQAQHERADRGVAGADRFRIFPVATRVDTAEKVSLDRAREFAKRAFGGFIEHLPPDKREEYWGEVYVPYESFYAYQEILATVADEPGLRGSILTSFERLVEFVTGETVRERSPSAAAQRSELKRLFQLGPEPQRIRVILSNRPELQGFSDELTRLQKSWRETKADQYLLGEPQINRLQANIELMIAMLEDPAFREFWDVSHKTLQRRAVQRSALLSVATLVGAGAPLLVSAILDLPASAGARTLVMAALASICGSASSALVSASAPRAFTWGATSRVYFLVHLAFAASLGAVTVGILELQSAATIIGIAFIAGFWSRQALPETLDKVAATLDTSRRSDK